MGSFKMHLNFTNGKVNQLRGKQFQCISKEHTSIFQGTRVTCVNLICIAVLRSSCFQLSDMVMIFLFCSYGFSLPLKSMSAFFRVKNGFKDGYRSPSMVGEIASKWS